MSSERDTPRLAPWRERIHEVIFEADTRVGKAFDAVLLVAILLSVTAVIIDSVPAIHERWGTVLLVAEWTFTILFTVEYVLRLLSVRQPWRYALSFYGIVDLLAIVPTYLSLFITGTQALIVIRALRLLRVFRVFKLARFLGEVTALANAIRATRAKITVFLFTMLTLVTIMGTLMYLIEGEQGGFDTIPRAIYWAIVTVTTVGYGDIAPQTVLGQAVAAAAMIMGYSLIIIPTGIFSMELARVARHEDLTTQHCPACAGEGHDADAKFCKHCGSGL